MDWLRFVAEIIGSLSWPAAIVIAVFLLRKEIRNLIPALRSLEYKGFRADFGERVAKAEVTAEEAQVLPAESAAVITIQESRYEVMESIAEHSPQAAVVEAWRFLESDLRDAARRSNLDVSARLPVNRLLRDLRQRELVSEGLFNLIETLRKLRNEAAHTPGTYLAKEEALEYIDIVRRVEATLVEA